MSEETVHVEDEKLPEETVNEEVEETTEPIETEEVEEVKETVEEPVEETVGREIYTMPVAKAQKEKKRALDKLREELAEEHKAEMEKLNTSTPVVDSELKTYAEEQGLDLAMLDKIVGFAQKPLNEKLSKVDTFMAEKEKEAHFTKVRQEFDERVSTLIKTDYPNVSTEHIAKIKETITDLAFSKEYQTYKLEDIYKVNKNQFEYKDNPGIEPSDGNTVEITDFSTMTDEQEHKLAHENPQKFGEFIKWQDAQNSAYKDA